MAALAATLLPVSITACGSPDARAEERAARDTALIAAAWKNDLSELSRAGRV